MGAYANFYNSDNNDRVYDAESFAEWLRPFFRNGVFKDEMQVTANNDMTVTVAVGNAYVDGKTKCFDTAQTFTVEAAHATLSRIDNVIMRRDDASRDFTVFIQKGAFSSEPVAPAITRENGIYDLVLAQIYVEAAAISIRQENITDTRPDLNLCGYVASTIDQMDFSQFSKQFEAYYAAFKAGNEKDFSEWSADQKADMESYQAEEKAAFNAWYELIRGNLSEDAAGNLQLQVNDLKDSAAPISQKKTTVYDGDTVTTTLADGRKTVTTYSGDTVTDRMYSAANVLQWTKTTIYNGDTVTETIEEAK